MALLEVEGLHTYYGNIEALKGDRPRGRGGRDRHADRLQRRRQVHHAALDLRAHAPSAGSVRFDGEEIGETPPQDIVRKGISQSPEGRHVFQRMTVRENLELGAYLRARRPHRKRPGARLRAVPAAQGARAPEGGHDVRRRAADARDRAGDDGRAQAAAARRAVDGSCAPCWSSASTRPSPRSTSAARPSCSSSRTRTSRSRSPRAPTCSRPAPSPCRTTRPTLRENPEVQKAYLGA